MNGDSYLSFVMPLFPEGSLATWLCRRGNLPRLSLLEVSHLLTQAGDALQHAHQQHITHHNIKPENLLLRSRVDSPLPDFFLADFGMATLVATSSADRQKARGSPIFMAPEQWEGHPVAATDQYALAIMTYSLLAGRPPYGGSQEQLVYQHMHVQPQPPSHFTQDIPPALDAIILRALAKQPEDRFDSVLTFARAFSQALSHTVASAHSTPQSSPPVAAAVLVSKPESTHHQSRTRGVGIWLCLLAALVLVSSIGGSIILSHVSTAPQTMLPGAQTATAQVATATTRRANPNPYPPYTGALVFSDPMTSDRFNWTAGSTNDAMCTFTDGAYQVMGKKSGFANPCLGSGILFSNYRNFAFEVHMSLIKGTGGGIRFRISSVGSYNFEVYQDGHYSLTIDDSAGDYHAKLLGASAPASIKMGLQQTNILAVVASGTEIDLYVNHLRIGSTHDSFSTQGSFGLLADQESQVAFSAARLWT